MLAGDTLRSVADLAVPLVAVSLVYRRGYFRQLLDGNGQQTEQPQAGDPDRMLEAVEARATVEIEGRQVAVRAWKYTVVGVTGATVAVYLLIQTYPRTRLRSRADQLAVWRRLALPALSGDCAGAGRAADSAADGLQTYIATT